MKRSLALLMYIVMTAALLAGCSAGRDELSAADPVTLTMWHVYGSQTESPLNTLIDQFNRTEGKDRGVAVSVVSVNNSTDIDAALIASAAGDPGSVELPDLFTAYPRVAEKIGTQRLLDWSRYLTEAETQAYLADFLREGQWGDELLMLPIAKSTELCFVNRTLFDRFAEAAGTGADVYDMTDFDRLFALCSQYCDWSGGGTLFQINDFYHYFLVNVASLGGEFIVDGRPDFDSEAFRRVWMPMAQAGIHGGLCVQDGYASDRWKTAEVLSNIGSSAGILYLRDYVTYPDNTTEDIETLILPYPTFQGASPTVMQRGTGLFALRSEDERRNKAAAVFAKWITQGSHNVEFATRTGYMPVTQEGFENLMHNVGAVENDKYRMLYGAVGDMYGSYRFLSLPRYEGAADVQSALERSVKQVLSDAHAEYLSRVQAGEAASPVTEELADRALEELEHLMAQ